MVASAFEDGRQLMDLCITHTGLNWVFVKRIRS